MQASRKLRGGERAQPKKCPHTACGCLARALMPRTRRPQALGFGTPGASSTVRIGSFSARRCGGGSEAASTSSALLDTRCLKRLPARTLQDGARVRTKKLLVFLPGNTAFSSLRPLPAAPRLTSIDSFRANLAGTDAMTRFGNQKRRHEWKTRSAATTWFGASSHYCSSSRCSSPHRREHGCKPGSGPARRTGAAARGRANSSHISTNLIAYAT